MYGASVFPNMFIDLTGTVVIATRAAAARRPSTRRCVTDYLFRPEVIAEPGFDPTEMVEFSELVAHQDYVVCERVQHGVSLPCLHARGLRGEGRAALPVQPALPRGT